MWGLNTMTEDNLIKKGGLPKNVIMQTGHKTKLPLSEYYISVDTDNKEFLDFMDKEIDNLIIKFKNKK